MLLQARRQTNARRTRSGHWTVIESICTRRYDVSTLEAATCLSRRPDVTIQGSSLLSKIFLEILPTDGAYRNTVRFVCYLGTESCIGLFGMLLYVSVCGTGNYGFATLFVSLRDCCYFVWRPVYSCCRCPRNARSACRQLRFVISHVVE